MTRLRHWLRSVEWVDVTLLAAVVVLVAVLAAVVVLVAGAALSSCGRGG